MENLAYTKLSEQAMSQLGKNGAFLITKDGQVLNAMTISWASIGTIWSKPIMTVAVRYSRFTYPIIDKAKEFSISIPKQGEMKSELAFCGSKSGRDYDKFSECNLTAGTAREISTPIIKECKIHFECKVVYKQAMEPGLVDESIKKTYYNSLNDYHVLYYGEIVDCYTT